MTPPLVLEAAAASEAILKPSQVLSGLLTGNSRTSNRGLFSSSWLHQQRTANIRITMLKKRRMFVRQVATRRFLFNEADLL